MDVLLIDGFVQQIVYVQMIKLNGYVSKFKYLKIKFIKAYTVIINIQVSG